MARTSAAPKKEKREMTPATRVVTFNVHRALKGYVSSRLAIYRDCDTED